MYSEKYKDRIQIRTLASRICHACPLFGFAVPFANQDSTPDPCRWICHTTVLCVALSYPLHARIQIRALVSGPVIPLPRAALSFILHTHGFKSGPLQLDLSHLSFVPLCHTLCTPGFKSGPLRLVCHTCPSCDFVIPFARPDSNPAVLAIPLFE